MAAFAGFHERETPTVPCDLDEMEVEGLVSGGQAGAHLGDGCLVRSILANDRTVSHPVISVILRRPGKTSQDLDPGAGSKSCNDQGRVLIEGWSWG